MKTYSETQYFRHTWPYKLIIAISVIVGLVLYYTVMDQLDSMNKSIFFIALFPAPILLYFFSLKTSIDHESIKFNMSHIVKKEILWSEIVEAKVIDYGFVGGWGIRLATKYGTVYNVSGSRGLYLKLSNARQIVIGTQQEEELKRYLDQYHSKFMSA